MPRSLAARARSIPVWSLAQTNVAEDQVDLFAIEHGQRLVEVVDSRDDLIAGVAEHIFIVERGQRLVLDDEDALDDLLASCRTALDPNR